MARDIRSDVSPAISLAVDTHTASANGSAVDLQGYEAALVLVVTGTITDGSHAIGLQESDDASTWSNVASSDILGTLPTIGATDDDKTFTFGYIGSKRYLRVTTTVSGATSGGAYGALVLRGHPRHRS